MPTEPGNCLTALEMHHLETWLAMPVCASQQQGPFPLAHACCYNDITLTASYVYNIRVVAYLVACFLNPIPLVWSAWPEFTATPVPVNASARVTRVPALRFLLV
jgi:hypothetical protein